MFFFIYLFLILDNLKEEKIMDIAKMYEKIGSSLKFLSYTAA